MNGPNESAETRQTINPRAVKRKKLKLCHRRDPSGGGEKGDIQLMQKRGVEETRNCSVACFNFLLDFYDIYSDFYSYSIPFIYLSFTHTHTDRGAVV